MSITALVKHIFPPLRMQRPVAKLQPPGAEIHAKFRGVRLRSRIPRHILPLEKARSLCRIKGNQASANSAGGEVRCFGYRGSLDEQAFWRIPHLFVEILQTIVWNGRLEMAGAICAEKYSKNRAESALKNLLKSC